MGEILGKFFWHFMPPLTVLLLGLLIEREEVPVERNGADQVAKEASSYLNFSDIDIEIILWPLLIFGIWLMVLRIATWLIKSVKEYLHRRKEAKRKEEDIKKQGEKKAIKEKRIQKEDERKNLVSLIENLIRSEEDHLMNNIDPSWISIQKDREDIIYRLKKLGFAVPSNEQKKWKEFYEYWIQFLCQVKPIVEDWKEKDHLDLWESIISDNIPF